MGNFIVFGSEKAPYSLEALWGRLSQTNCSFSARIVALSSACSYVSSGSISHPGLFSVGKTEKGYFWNET